jgi:hypothetical protein
MKRISPKLFYPHELQEGGEISILQIKSYDNLVDLFTNSLPLAIFDKCVNDIGMRRLRGKFSPNKNPMFLINTEKIYYLFYRNQVTYPV